MRPPFWTGFAEAFASFERVMELDGTDEIVRDSAIKRFEYTFEAAVRALRLAVGEHFGIDPLSIPVNEVFRYAARGGYVQSAESWIAYRKARNQTVHVYHEDDVRLIYVGLPHFRRDAGWTLDRIRTTFPEAEAPDVP